MFTWGCLDTNICQFINIRIWSDPNVRTFRNPKGGRKDGLHGFVFLRIATAVAVSWGRPIDGPYAPIPTPVRRWSRGAGNGLSESKGIRGGVGVYPSRRPWHLSGMDTVTRFRTPECSVVVGRSRLCLHHDVD